MGPCVVESVPSGLDMTFLELSQVQSTRWTVAVWVYYSSTCTVTLEGCLAGCGGTITSCASTSVAAILIPVLQFVVCVMYCVLIHVHMGCMYIYVSCDADLSTIGHLKWSCNLVPDPPTPIDVHDSENLPSEVYPQCTNHTCTACRKLTHAQHTDIIHVCSSIILIMLVFSS